MERVSRNLSAENAETAAILKAVPRETELQNAMEKGLCVEVSGDGLVIVSGFWSASHLLALTVAKYEKSEIARCEEIRQVRADNTDLRNRVAELEAQLADCC
jgi:uncharacterized protein YuzE